MSEPGWKEWNRGDLIYGLIIPLLVAVLILLWPFIMKALVGPHTTVIGGILTVGVFQIICVTAIPVFAGLTWNRWAGGASGFLMGFIYFISVMVYYGKSGAAIDVSWQAYLVAAMVGGFMAGSLIRDSFNFGRMLLVGIVVAIFQGSLLVWTFDLVYHAFAGFPGGPLFDLAGLQVPFWFYVSFTNFVPTLIGGIFAALFAKIFAWFALAPRLLKMFAT